AHLKWAFAEAACLFLRESEQAKKWLARREKKHGKARALGALAARVGRTVYHLLRKREVFDSKRFFASQQTASGPRSVSSKTRRPTAARRRTSRTVPGSWWANWGQLGASVLWAGVLWTPSP